MFLLGYMLGIWGSDCGCNHSLYEAAKEQAKLRKKVIDGIFDGIEVMAKLQGKTKQEAFMERCKAEIEYYSK